MTRVVAIVGGTAVGKTELSFRLARDLDAEIVSVDSMQVYRGMDIGTAKPDPAMRAAVPHHMLDLFDPDDDVTVAEFQRLARAAIEDITARGRLPMLVGGSGLYYRAVVDELSFPPRSEDVRRRLEDEVEELGPQAMFDRLQELDPRAASKIEPGNARRTVRALEVIELTGRPFSENATWDRYESIYDLFAIGVSRPREVLYERIAHRVDEMLAAGLEYEVRTLATKGLSRTAGQALGYRQVLEAGEGSVRDEIVRATKRFARRQESWFRADPRIEWFDLSDEGAAERVEARLEDLLRLT